MYCVTYSILEYSYSKAHPQAEHHILYICIYVTSPHWNSSFPQTFFVFSMFFKVLLKMLPLAPLKIVLNLIQILGRGVMIPNKFTNIT